MKNVTVIGCGNGGMALAADLKTKGAGVALYANPDHSKKLDAILNHGNEIVLDENETFKSAHIDFVTTDLSKAVKFGEIIYICLPMNLHVEVFHQIAEIVNSGEDIKFLINLSGVFSGVNQYLQTPNKDIFRKLIVCDSSTFPYACRTGDSNHVSIYGRKQVLPLAPLFKVNSGLLDQMPDAIKPIPFELVNDIFKLGLMGINAVLHPPIVLCNLNLISSGRDFLFYREGTSKETTRLNLKIDLERLELAKTMGYSLQPILETMNHLYGTKYTTLAELFKNLPAYAQINGPKSLTNRVVDEDASYSLVALLTLAELYHVQLPGVHSIVETLSTISEKKYLDIRSSLNGLNREIIELLRQPAQKAPSITLFNNPSCIPGDGQKSPTCQTGDNGTLSI